jgi:RES domain-containing protein
VNLWRITPKPAALDKACTGTRLYGGRWNPAGYPALYAGTTIELCALEKLAHALEVQQPELALVMVQVPDDPALFLKPAVPDLPAQWAAVPVRASSQEFGRRWLAAAKQLVLLLPSAIIQESTVAMINPAHPAYDQVHLNFVRDFSFDPRLRRG